MSPTPFVLAEGVELVLGPGTLVVRHTGDVVLEQTLGRRLVRLDSGGDVVLRAPRSSGVVVAKGHLTVAADTDAEELRAHTVEIGAVEVNTAVIVATSRIVIGAGARVSVDILIAPEIVIDPSALGRVKLMDCLNDRQPTKVRGCLSLNEYESDNGGVAEFLARRGVTPLNPLPPGAEDTARVEVAAAAPQAQPEVAPVRVEVPVAPPARVEAPPERAPEPEAVVPVIVVAQPPPEPAPHRAPAIRSAAPTLVALEAADDEPAPPARAAPQARHQTQLRRAWSRIEDAYGANPPAAVRRLGEIVARTPSELPDQLDTLWRDTLREHIARGTQPPRPVILAFHALKALAA